MSKNQVFLKFVFVPIRYTTFFLLNVTKKTYSLCNKITRIRHWSTAQNDIYIEVFGKLRIKSRRMRNGGQEKKCIQSYMVEKHRARYYFSKDVGVGRKTIFKLTFKNHD